MRLRVLYGCALETRSPFGIERWWLRLERFDVNDRDWSTASPLTSLTSPSTTSSSYAHPFGRVGRRKRIGIFVVFSDNGGVVFHLDVMLKDCVDKVSCQRFGLAASAFRRDHALGCGGCRRQDSKRFSRS